MLLSDYVTLNRENRNRVTGPDKETCSGEGMSK